MTTHGLKHLIVIAVLKSLVFKDSMGVGAQSGELTPEVWNSTAKLVQDIVSSDEIVIFSKTYCPYCKLAKQVFDALNCHYTVVELDQREDGGAIQSVLGSMTGVRTVPRVFIRGQCIGGGKEIKALYESGTLLSMLK